MEISISSTQRPKDAVWLFEPHALNYFKDELLYRTKGRELRLKPGVLDLMYGNHRQIWQGSAAEEATETAFLGMCCYFYSRMDGLADIKDLQLLL